MIYGTFTVPLMNPGTEDENRKLVNDDLEECLEGCFFRQDQCKTGKTVFAHKDPKILECEGVLPMEQNVAEMLLIEYTNSFPTPSPAPGS